MPVVAAGGISDGRHLAMSLALGADAVWVGTRFVASVEGGAPKGHKDHGDGGVGDGGVQGDGGDGWGMGLGWDMNVEYSCRSLDDL